MNVEFVLLGSGAVRPNPRRMGPSQALVVDEEVLMFDCGPGAVHALASAGFRAEEIEHLFLTHLHFDHCSDLPYLALLAWTVGRSGRLTVYGPRGTREFVETSIRKAYTVDIATRIGHGRDPAPLESEVVEIENAGPFCAGSIEMTAQFVQHAQMDNIAYRVNLPGLAIVVTGDCNYSDDLVELARGADLLVCECSGTRESLDRFPWGTWHMTPQTVGKLAREANVARTVLKHFVIEDVTGDLEAAGRMAATAAEIAGRPVEAGFDGMRIALEPGA